MNTKSFLVSSLLSAGILLTASTPVLALDVPNFPSCQSPTGILRVSYDSGIHGIVGDAGQFVGSDRVYTVSDSNLIQCFCSTEGRGIQTDWWKQASLSESQINTLRNLGWFYIPSGLLWGLDDAPYFAKNTNYSCGSNGGSGGGGTSAASAPNCDSAKPNAPTLVSVVRNGSSATLTWTPVSNATHYTLAYGLKPNDYIYGVPNTGNVTTYTVNALDPNQTYYFAVKAVNSCMPSDFSPSQNFGGQVLGLATTGTAQTILGFTAAGIVLLALSLILRRKINRAA
jgi:hypothetical protein